MRIAGCSDIKGSRHSGGGVGIKEWQRFYSTKAWKDTREAYKASVGGICEACWSKGIIKAGEFVHHKTPLTPDNINDPDTTLGFGNLQCLCRDCHAKVHDKKMRRYKLDELGRVVFL